MRRTLCCWLLFLFAVTEVQGDDPAPTKAAGRIVGGRVLAAGSKPVQGATVLFGPSELGGEPLEGVRAISDAQGRYRADLGKSPWSGESIRAIVLAPGYKAAEKTIAAGAGPATADFELTSGPWKEIQIQMADNAGKAVAGEVITCSVRWVVWARLKTDAGGRCSMMMTRYLPISLTSEPEGARALVAQLSGTDDEPASITLPVLPPIRGRVLDAQGWPVQDAAVGRWLTFDADGSGEMLPFFGGALAVTDRHGDFEIAPELRLRFYTSQPMPKLEGLCFADPSYRDLCYQLYKPGQPIRVAYRLYDPRRAAEPMTVTLKPSRRVRIPISRGFVTANRETSLYSQLSIRPRAESPEWLSLLINRVKPANGSATGPQTAVLEENLPDGTYRLEVSLTDVKSDETLGVAQREIVVPPGEGSLDLPPLALEQPFFKKMAGKPAPEIDATDLDTGRPVKLADFRSKVVLLEFWGYWCGPCNFSMPFLAELHRKFEGRPFVILALHDQSVQSREVYNQKTATTRERVWGGRDLPFRVLLDRPDPNRPADRRPEGTGTTIERYGIDGFPTLFLIDRDGNMVEPVAHTEHDRLESLVRKLVERAEKK